MLAPLTTWQACSTLRRFFFKNQDFCGPLDFQTSVNEGIKKPNLRASNSSFSQYAFLSDYLIDLKLHRTKYISSKIDSSGV